MMLPKKYAGLASEPGPLLVLEALKLVGTLEMRGPGNNPTIVKWADEVAAAFPSPYNNWAADWYNADSIAWCGLFAAVCEVRANPGGRLKGRQPPTKYLSAKEWLNYGFAIPKDKAMLGDILIFDRDGGGHVAIYVGEDATAFHIVGGNQSDAVTITRKLKSECIGVRRPLYNKQPANVRKILYGPDGPLSTNES